MDQIPSRSSNLLLLTFSRLHPRVVTERYQPLPAELGHFIMLPLFEPSKPALALGATTVIVALGGFVASTIISYH